ncbi:MAG: hypothetical protein FGM39_04035 [Phycisphaerales bacterium]|nr:hypothetical protein [Phycisphaerales bacterium]
MAPRLSIETAATLPAYPARGGIASTLATLAAVLLTMAVMATVPGAGSGSMLSGVTTLVDSAAPGATVVRAARLPAPGTTATPACRHRAADAQLARRAAILLRHTSLPPPARA